MKTKYIVAGLLSGLTWCIDIQLINMVTIQSIILVSLLHDFTCLLVGLRNLRLSKLKLELLFGFLISSLGTLGFIASIKLDSPIAGVIGSSSIPIVTYILSGRYTKRETIRYALASVLLLMIMIVANSSLGVISVAGCIGGIICSLGWSTETVVVEKYAKNIPSEVITSLRMLCSSSTLVVAFFVVHEYDKISILSDYKSLALIATAGLVCYLSYNLWYSAIKNLGAPLGNGLNLSYLIFTTLVESRSLSSMVIIILAFTYIVNLVYKSE